MCPGVFCPLLLPHCCHFIVQMLSMSVLLTLGEVLAMAKNLR